MAYKVLHDQPDVFHVQDTFSESILGTFTSKEDAWSFINELEAHDMAEFVAIMQKEERFDYE